MSNLHAHIARTATDCDGRYDTDYITKMDEVGEFAELRFRDRVLGGMVSFSGMGGTLKVTTGVENGQAWERAEWSEQTEEGFTHIEALFCRDECDVLDHHYRDHTAEAAGY